MPVIARDFDETVSLVTVGGSVVVEVAGVTVGGLLTPGVTEVGLSPPEFGISGIGDGERVGVGEIVGTGVTGVLGDGVTSSVGSGVGGLSVGGVTTGQLPALGKTHVRSAAVIVYPISSGWNKGAPSASVWNA